MKILKDGRKENKPVSIKCGHCKSDLEVEPVDIHKKHYDQRDGNAYEFKCAVCGHSIWVDMNRMNWNGI